MTARRCLGFLAGIAAALIVAPAALADPGAIDASFGTNGVTVSSLGPTSTPFTSETSAAIAPNGDIYQTGLVLDASANPALYLARYLPTGALDHGFGAAGVSVVQIGQGSTPATGALGASGQLTQRIAFTSSGDIVVPTAASDVAGNTQIAVAEFKPDGGLDTSFAAAGAMPGVYYDDTTSTPDTSGDPFRAAIATVAAVQSDGKIVFSAVADPAGSAPETFIRRLKADGTVDTGFASGGTYTAPGGTSSVPSQINDMLLNSAGDIVFAGGTDYPSGISQTMLGELTPDGTEATGFPIYYQSSSLFPDSMGYSVFQAADGDYIVGAGSNLSTNSMTGASVDGWIAVAFKPSGAVDTSFGPSGSGQSALGPAAPVPAPTTTVGPTSIAQQADGRLVFTGLGGLGGGPFTVARTLASGTLDAGFGSDGVETYGFGAVDQSRSVAITADGQLLLAGQSATGTLSITAVLMKIILDSPPSLVIAAGSAIAGQPVSLSAQTLSNATISSITWDLGSGSFTDASGPTATKTFAQPGTYTVRAQATDADGMSTIASQTVTVSSPPPALPPSYCTASARPTAKVTTKSLSSDGLIIAGTAAAHCPRIVQSVSLAIARTTGKKCSFLTSRHRWSKDGSCNPKTYLAASGTYSWGFGLRLKLIPATYWIWARATDDQAVSTNNTVGDHTALRLSQAVSRRHLAR
jgi:uncharacterized delta-60 repeat protein